MSINLSGFKRFLTIFSLLASVALLGGCFLEGDDGATGAAGPAGPAGPEGPAGEDVDPDTVDDLQAQIDELVQGVQPESCATCHADVGEEEHQALYDRYVDASDLTLAITEVDAVPDGENFDVTVTFEITKDGLPFVDAAGLPHFDQKRMAAVMYDPLTRTFDGAFTFGDFTPTATPGEYTAFRNDMPYDPTGEGVNAHIFAYIADEMLEEIHPEISEDAAVHLYENVASASFANGAAAAAHPDAYDSYANVSGCERCHGTPYRKHGYREAQVEGLPEFASCKVCHYDTRPGGHEDWQILVEDPLRFTEVHAGDPLTAEEEAYYAYTANIMNDVHMAHSMEFPYPQSMANCVTCHEGHLPDILAAEQFTADTCRSCHPVEQSEYGTESNRAPALTAIWEELNVGFHDIDDTCTVCHGAGVGKDLDEIHTGYNREIYTDANDGTTYDDVYEATVDSVSLADNVLDIRFSATKNDVLTTDITAPMVLVSFYGWDSKQFVLPAHARDGNGLRTEKVIGTDNALFTEEADSVTGDWHVTLDLAAYAADPGIPDMIASGKIKRLEVSVRPTLQVDNPSLFAAPDATMVAAVRAPSATLELASNTIDDDHFKGANAVVEAEKCNVCHDALATTFHTADRHGNIVLCKNCHAPVFPGSHLEMQSRSIESYVHAIHSFQAFDFGDVDFTDPVEAVKYEIHVEHTFPKFTIRNCEACHLPGVYNVPDQTQSLPGVNSASDSNDTIDRNIGTVPEYVMGPASRACGGCHRAEFINRDQAGDLAAWNQHTKTFGYLVENDPDDITLFSIIDKIMTMFE